MSLEADHVEFGLQLALTVIAMSLALLVDINEFTSYVYLLGIPLLLGYTAVTSENSFKRSSFGAGISLAFIPINMFVAALAVFVFCCNVLVSFFASGSSFKDHYSATAVPLIFLGLLIGGSLGGYAFYDAEFQSNLENNTIETGTQKTVEMIEIAGIDQDSSKENVLRVSESTITLTEAQVINEYSSQNEDADEAALRDSFESAESDVPETILEQSSAADIEQSTEDMLENTLSGRISAAVFILSVAVLYGLQPVLGFLTAVFARLFVIFRESL